MNEDESEPLSELQEALLRAAQALHEEIADDPAMKTFLKALPLAKLSDRKIHDIAQHILSRYGPKMAKGWALLVLERLMADEDEAAMTYMRIFRAMADLETTEPEPDEKLH